MFFLLPAKQITDPVVSNFRQSLSQFSETNYQTLPLYNLRLSNLREGEQKTENKSESTQFTRPVATKKSNAATKSRAQPIIPFPSCSNCNWIFPEKFPNEDKDIHSTRCSQGLGEQDKMFWIKCKGNRIDYK